MDPSIYMLLGVLTISFACEYMDASLGMGYGTTLTPVLMLMGFAPLQIVPAILVSQLFAGLFAAFMHHKLGNANFRPETINPRRIVKSLNALGYIETYRRGVPLHLKVAILLSLCSIIGTVASVFVAVNIPNFYLKLYIGILVLSMGVLILIFFKKSFRFSWTKMSILGMIASFNKGMSGGGYGPVVTGGQILSGLEGPNAVAITSLSEGVTCFVGILTYTLVQRGEMDWSLVPWLATGAVLSVPLSTATVKKIRPVTLKTAIAFITMGLGIFTLIKIF